MLGKVKRFIVWLRLFFIEGCRDISEASKKSDYYSILKSYGITAYVSSKGTYLVEGTKILLSAAFNIQVVDLDKIYLLVYDPVKGNLVYKLERWLENESDYWLENVGNDLKDERPVNKLSFIMQDNDFMPFQIIKKFGVILFTNSSRHIILNLINEQIINDGPGKCKYLKNLNIFSIADKNGYKIYRPVLDSHGKMEAISNTGIKSKDMLEDNPGLKLTENKIILAKANNLSICKEYDYIKKLPMPIGNYTHIAKKNNEFFLLYIDVKINELKIPGENITRIFESTEDFPELSKYVIIKNEAELIIASILDTEMREIKRYPNGVSLNIKEPKLDINSGGVIIPITVTTVIENEEKL